MSDLSVFIDQLKCNPNTEGFVLIIENGIKQQKLELLDELQNAYKEVYNGSRHSGDVYNELINSLKQRIEDE